MTIGAAGLISDAGPASPRARKALHSDPRFPAAVRQTAVRLLDLHQGNRLLNLIVSDRGRFLVGFLALDLHFRREEKGIGLTPGRLKALCVEYGICSATRASALLALMRLGGYVQEAPVRGDRRINRLEPTERLVSAQRERWRCNFLGAAPFLPDASRALAAIDRPEFMRSMVLQMCGHFHAGFRILDLAPSLRLFGERNGGFFVLFTLLAAAGDTASPRDALPVSISAIARRVGCSRAHIIKLLGDAAAEGLVERTASNSIVLQPRLVDEAHDFFAAGFLILTHCALTAIEACLHPIETSNSHAGADAEAS